MKLTLLKKIIRNLDKQLPKPRFYKIRMTHKELLMLDRYLKKSKVYLEFGSGGSTLRALQMSEANIFSVESSKEWMDHLNGFRIIKKHRNKRLWFYFANIGETKKYGFPNSSEQRELFPNYSKGVFTVLDTLEVDTVLIDGRFRVACVLSTILNVSNKENVTIMVHDFWQREHYHAILKYLDLIERVDAMGVFKIKSQIDMENVQKEYDEFKFIAN